MKRRVPKGQKRKPARRTGAARPSRRSAKPRKASGNSQKTELQNLRRERDDAIEQLKVTLEQLRESLEQQTATSEVLSVISRSKFDLQPILQSVVETAERLCRAEQTVIFRLEDGAYRFAAGHSRTPEYLEIERQTVIFPGQGTVVGRAVLTRHVARIDDAWSDPLYEKKGDARIGGARSMIGVPLMRQGEPIGAIGLARSQVDPFTDREIELVVTFADQAVIAIENARLFEAEQERTRELSELLEQQTATANVLSVISASPGDLAPVFDAMLESATRLCGANFGTFFLRDGAALRLVARHVPPEGSTFFEVGSKLVLADNEGHPLVRVLETKNVFHVADLRADPSYAAGNPRVLAFVEKVGSRTVLGMPLIKNDECIGVIVTSRPEVRPFSDKQIDLVKNFAAQAVIAIENARLLSELRESLEQQTATSEVLSVISGSPGDLEPVFQSMLANAVRISDARFGIIHAWNGETLRLLATHNLPPELENARRGAPEFRPGPKTGRSPRGRHRACGASSRSARGRRISRGASAAGGRCRRNRRSSHHARRSDAQG